MPTLVIAALVCVGRLLMECREFPHSEDLLLVR